MANVAMDLRIGILGPLEVRVGFGEPVQVVGPRLRALLIRLAMEPDRVVLAGQLIDAVWDSDPPAAATGALQSLVSRLRRLLPDVVESHAIGYRMAIDPEAVDSVQFERLALAGRDELRGDPQRARELLREALALWRGPALADVATARFAGAAVARLEELRLGAIEDRIEAELATGSGQRLVAELDELVTANPLRERIEQAIGDKRLLLVMDNCEHLVAPAAALIDALLAHCPELRVLATSREPLGITGEVLHPVGPLAMPVQDGTASEALRFPAVRLFADRGAAARPGFTVDQATVGPVLDICRALDGIPLAIELAAARLRALSPDQIAARLDDRFRLLAGGSRTSLPRHQTLRAVVDWSWGLLGEPERVLARRLAVFPGGATLEAAERVCAGPDLGGLASDDVLYLLAALVEKSLVVASDGDSGEMRYSMLETMRAYGEERRVKAGEDQALRNAHAAYFLELAEEAEPHLRRAEQLEWIERLTTERENLHGALRWAIDIQDAEMARRALALSGPVSPAARAQAYSTAALTALSGGQDLTRSLEYLEHAAGVLSQVPPHDPAMLPIISAILRNDEVTAMEHAHRLRDNPDPWLRALARVIGGQLLINQGEARQAATEFEAGLEQFHELGERWGIGQTLFARVELSAYSADHDSVIAALQEAKEILAGLGDREDVGHIMVRSAHTRALAGDVEGARRDLEAAERIAEAVGAIEERLYNCWLRGQIERWEGNLDAARPVLESGLRESRDGIHPFGQIHSSILASLGHLELATGNLSAARGWYERAMVVALGTKDRPVMARVVELRAAVAVAEGDPERAATLLGEATTLRGLPDEADPDVARVRAAARAALGDEGYALAHQRGTARPRDQVEAALASEDMSAAGTPAAPAGRTPAR